MPGKVRKYCAPRRIAYPLQFLDLFVDNYARGRTPSGLKTHDIAEPDSPSILFMTAGHLAMPSFYPIRFHSFGSVTQMLRLIYWRVAGVTPSGGTIRMSGTSFTSITFRLTGASSLAWANGRRFSGRHVQPSSPWKIRCTIIRLTFAIPIRLCILSCLF